MLFGELILLSIQPMTSGKISIAHHVGPEHLAIFKGRDVCFV